MSLTTGNRFFKGIGNLTAAGVDNTNRHYLDPGTRLYFSEVFWCAESEYDLRIAPSRQIFEKS